MGGENRKPAASATRGDDASPFDGPAFSVDMQICTGCKTCMVACKDKNDLPVGISWRRVYEYSGGEWFLPSDGTFKQDVFAYYLSVAAITANSRSASSHPTTAMTQGEGGIS